MEEAAKLFPRSLLHWNSTENIRQMSWKGEKDPYRIWLSEVILQQTRVEQGLKYYENFTSAFPDVRSLAAAPEEQVFKLWEGLGYYSRCRNLIAAARHIANERNGVFPADYESILALKGVGPYTAAAIASFAYRLPYAVLDGNVFRVLSRIYGSSTPIDSTEGKKEFSQLAQVLLPKDRPGEYNQAIMDFGAVICKPYPECNRCFFSEYCVAYRTGRQDQLPVKEKKTKVRRRWFNYLVLQHGDEFLVRQRMENDIWQQLFEFLLIETPEELGREALLQVFEKQYAAGSFELKSFMNTRQKLSHQDISFQLLHLVFQEKTEVPGHQWVERPELANKAFPKTLQQFISTELK